MYSCIPCRFVTKKIAEFGKHIRTQEHLDLCVEDKSFETNANTSIDAMSKFNYVQKSLYASMKRKEKAAAYFIDIFDMCLASHCQNDSEITYLQVARALREAIQFDSEFFHMMPFNERILEDGDEFYNAVNDVIEYRIIPRIKTHSKFKDRLQFLEMYNGLRDAFTEDDAQLYLEAKDSIEKCIHAFYIDKYLRDERTKTVPLMDV